MNERTPRPATLAESRPSYGSDHPHREGFDGAIVLDDLARADGPGMLRILARYAVLRNWLLRTSRGRAVARHAARSAEAYLRAAEPGWPEASYLRRLLQDPGTPEAEALLCAAAMEAEATQHASGARGLRQAAWGIGEWRPSPS